MVLQPPDEVVMRRRKATLDNAELAVYLHVKLCAFYSLLRITKD